MGHVIILITLNQRNSMHFFEQKSVAFKEFFFIQLLTITNIKEITSQII